MTRETITITILLSIPIAVAAIWASIRVHRRKRRRELMSRPLPADWITVLEDNLPPYAKLTPDLKEQLHGFIQVFLAEKSFEGCGGLEITDEIRVTIAAQACLLLLNHDPTFYPKLCVILVYPHAYVGGGKGEPESVRLGESWDSGTVVLSWDDVRRGAANFQDGQNVTMHEFAHQLDQEDGQADGAPILESLSSYAAWAAILGKEYKQLIRKSRKGRKTVMDRYGTTNPAEFFAVATTTFFEKPRQLQRKHPELYEELKEYYRLDPMDWT